jgi:hypothetical protein
MAGIGIGGVLLLIVAIVGGGTAVMRRRGYQAGGRSVMRCSQGHFFTATFIPGASLISVRLGTQRYRHCPGRGHWAMCRPVKDEDLTPAQREEAAAHQGSKLP